MTKPLNEWTEAELYKMQADLLKQLINLNGNMQALESEIAKRVVPAATPEVPETPPTE